MQIYSCTQSPSFNGELIKTDKGRTAIKKCRDIKLLGKLNSAKKDLAGTDYFDIEVGENLRCKIRSLKDIFFGPFKSSVFKTVEQDELGNLVLDGKYCISKHSIYNNPDEARYNVMLLTENGDIENAENIDILVTIAKELDNAAKKDEHRSLQDTIDAICRRKLKQSLLN